MGLYVTATGFIKPTLQEFLQRMKARMVTIWGPEFDTGDTTPAGQFAGAWARVAADAADSDQEIYASLDPLQAVGEPLARIAALRGTFKQGSSPSQCHVVCYANAANEGLSLSPGRQVRRVRGGLVFSLRDTLIVTRTSCRDVYLSTVDRVPGTVLSVTTSFGTFGAVVTSTTFAAMQVIATAINDSAWGGTAQAYTSAVSSDQKFSGRALRIFFPNGDFQLVSAVNLSVEVVGSSGMFDATVDGPNDAAPGEVSEIVTPETGWLACYNLLSAVTGRNDETDEELRVRMYLRDGYSTEEAIRKKLMNSVSGVSSVTVKSNRSHVVDSDGRDPHSIEVVVVGGLDQEIADALWTVQPGGIKYWADMVLGGVEATVTDSTDRPQTIQFGRPYSMVLHARVRLHLYGEEVFPADGLLLVRDAILEWARTEFASGKDVLISRFYVPIYKIPGVRAADIFVGLSSSVSVVPTMLSQDISVGSRVTASLVAETLAVEFA